ncbi:MAG: hypothetical protein NKF70_12355 [Methanobacterium sp. ERen5]|nr:MAG: hypothetical protein NKF70_12355 [Methanobacterium sp. ERen5]
MKKFNDKNSCLIFVICFMMIMITPASANQIQTSINTEDITHSKISGNKITPSLKILNLQKQNSKKTVTKIGSKTNFPKNKKYASLIIYASKILPQWEKSYKNTSYELSASKKALKTLNSEEKNVTNQIQNNKNQIDNFKLTTTNTQEYNKLQNNTKHLIIVKKGIKATKKNIKQINNILEKKQKHTQNCIEALKNIKNSKNIQTSRNNYNKNIKSLETINNNIKAEIQKNKETIINSNKTTQELNNNIKGTDSSESNSKNTSKILLYVLAGTGSLMAASSIATIASATTYLILGYRASVITAAVNIELHTIINSASAAAVAGQGADALTVLGTAHAIGATTLPFERAAAAALTVTEVLFVITAILAVATVVIFVAYMVSKSL